MAIEDSLILNIPHHSTYIPFYYYDKAFLPSLSESSYKIEKKKKDFIIDYEHLVMTDWYTDELFDNNLCPSLKAEVSRLLCDTERFCSDEDEEMSKYGMGFYYTNSFDGTLIKNKDKIIKESIKKEFYYPYHNRLATNVENALEENNIALILDCHSFNPTKLPYEKSNHNSFDRKEICIGTDNYHTPKELLELTKSFFLSKGYSVSLNYPFSGSIVPLPFYKKEKRVLSIMIELNRLLYLLEGTNKKNKNFEDLKQNLEELEEALISFLN